MNEEAKEEKSVFGKAVKMVAVGSLAAIGSKTALDYSKKSNSNPNGKIIDDVEFKVSGDDVAETVAKNTKNTKNTENIHDVLNRQPKSLKKGLEGDALTNQIHLDNLKKGLKDRRAGKKIADLTGQTRRTVKRVTKAL